MATFTNQATLTYRGGATASNVVTGELLEALTLNKTATSADYAPGEWVVVPGVTVLQISGTV
jgi:hypothetical protein